MLVLVVLTNVMCLLMPALTSAHVITPGDSVDRAAHNLKRLSTPLNNLIHKRDTTLLASTAGPSNALALNTTNEEAADTTSFEDEVDIPGRGRGVYFSIKGEIDYGYSVTVEFWVHYQYDRTIGVFYGNLASGVDIKIPPSTGVVVGEARLYVVMSEGYEILALESYGNVNIPGAATQPFPDFVKAIKRWRVGDLTSIEDVPNNSGVPAMSNGASVNTS